nr:copper resistance protein CopB [Luteimonas sp. JM171]
MTSMSLAARTLGVAIAITLAGVSEPAFAQQMDHSKMHMPAPPAKPEPKTETQDTESDPHAGHAMPATSARPTPETTPAAEAVDHAAMGHGADHHMPMDGAAAGRDLPPDAAPLEPIPTVTPADRATAFPDVGMGHPVHGTSVQWFAQANRLETWDADEGDALAWDGSGWVGGDLNRIWVRSEGEAIDGSVESADVEVLYGRAIARWWDAVVGIRHDFGDDPSQTFAALGVVGLAPYMFEIEATAYLGESGQTGLGVEAEYETLFTNRLILQSLVEAEFWGKDDASRGIGSGLSKAEAGLRLRYEFTRQFAPYIGVVHERTYGGTADLRRARGDDIDDTRFVIGLRTWF